MKRSFFFDAQLFAIASLSLLSCNSLDDQLRRQADITGAAQADRTIQATNDDLTRKAEQMEKDLSTRRRFYQCVAGTFAGTVEASANDPLGGNRDVIVSLTAVLPPSYDSGRTRTETEIASDLNSVSFKAEVQISNPSLPDIRLPGNDGWLPGNYSTAIFENVRSDLTSGKVDLISASSPTRFTLWLMPHENSGKSGSRALIRESSRGLTKSVIEGSDCEITHLWMDMKVSKISSKLYGTELRRLDSQ